MASKARWSAKLARPVVLKDGTKLVTLSDARAFILALPEGDQQRNSWQRAAGKLMVAATLRGDIEAATKAIESALFLQARWLPK